MPSLYISNLFDVLLYKLEKNLFEEKAFFRKLIILPSDLLKEVLYKKWSKEQGVNTGFKVLKLPAAIDYLMRLVRFQHGKTPHFSAPMLLSLHLEALLQERLQDNEERDLFQPIFDYLQGDLFQKKLQGLCDELSSEFLHYGLYGGKGLKLFCEKRSWQQSLWETVMRVWDAPQLFFEEKRFDNSLNFKIDI
ncbi:MAG: exonuclease V subunit gamma, partial [Chlamydiae bacterium]|nr:exonuclease V subunit gamma [Chlamydiota bacterium]